MCRVLIAYYCACASMCAAMSSYCVIRLTPSTYNNISSNPTIANVMNTDYPKAKLCLSWECIAETAIVSNDINIRNQYNQFNILTDEEATRANTHYLQST